jgi:ABC-2 type transport system permease protein
VSESWVIARLTARRSIRSAVVWGYVFGAVVASSAWSYTELYKTTASRLALERTFSNNEAMSALFGPGNELQTVAGFTAYKVTMTIAILGAVWGLLASTRALRGEEDDGRWEVLLAGPTTKRRATATALGGLGGAVATLWAVTAVICLLAGQLHQVDIAPGAALDLALALAATPVMFVAVGALTSQLVDSRRAATGFASGILGLSYALRMVGDAGVHAHWLDWVSPIGWVELLQPLTSPRPMSLIPIAVFTGTLSVAAVQLSSVRDVTEGILTARGLARRVARPMTRPIQLAVRLARPTVVGWWTMVVVAASLYGLIAKSSGATIAGSSVQQVLQRLGAAGSGTDVVLGICFLVVAVFISVIAAGQVTAARGEESSGRLDQLLSRAVTRTSWLGGRLVIAVTAVVVAGVLTGLCAWIGAASEHAGVRLATLVVAGLNLVPPALVVLGAGTLAFGLWPKACTPCVYAVLTWSLVIEVVGGIGATNHWLLDTSVFHQMASAPAVHPNWPANGVMVAVGVVSLALGVVAFGRRDLEGA